MDTTQCHRPDAYGPSLGYTWSHARYIRVLARMHTVTGSDAYGYRLGFIRLQAETNAEERALHLAAAGIAACNHIYESL